MCNGRKFGNFGSRRRGVCSKRSEGGAQAQSSFTYATRRRSHAELGKATKAVDERRMAGTDRYSSRLAAGTAHRPLLARTAHVRSQTLETRHSESRRGETGHSGAWSVYQRLERPVQAAQLPTGPQGLAPPSGASAAACARPLPGGRAPISAAHGCGGGDGGGGGRANASSAIGAHGSSTSEAARSSLCPRRRGPRVASLPEHT